MQHYVVKNTRINGKHTHAVTLHTQFSMCLMVLTSPSQTNEAISTVLYCLHLLNHRESESKRLSPSVHGDRESFSVQQYLFRLFETNAHTWVSSAMLIHTRLWSLKKNPLYCF